MSEYQSAVGDGDGGGASIAPQAQERVQQTAEHASHAVARYAKEQTESRGKQAAQELQTLADALRRSSHTLHADGKSTTANGVESVIGRIEGLGHYLQTTDGDKLVRDLESFGRRKPWGMIGVGLGIGVAASRFLKASSTRRFEQSQGQMQAFGSKQPSPSTNVHTSSASPVPVSTGAGG
jgi:ElaB/YqjD/DUF883 family membrane-anchored ribosome-binding protein